MGNHYYQRVLPAQSNNLLYLEQEARLLKRQRCHSSLDTKHRKPLALSRGVATCDRFAQEETLDIHSIAK